MRGSTAVAVMGLPPAISDGASALIFSSVPARNEKTTSSAVSGVPSDHLRPSRRYSVWVRPSGLDSQRSANHGSSSNVDRFTRTRRAWVSTLSSSADCVRTVMRLKERGSARTVVTSCPPRRGASLPSLTARLGATGRKYQMPPSTSAAVIKAPTKRENRPI